MAAHHTALIYTMVIVSAADREMTDEEMRTIGEIVQYLPVFRDFPADDLPRIAAECASLLQEDDGLETVLDRIVANLPSKLGETAYALACEVAAADGRIEQETLRLLEIIRHRMEIDRLSAAAIERAVRARHVTV